MYTYQHLQNITDSKLYVWIATPFVLLPLSSSSLLFFFLYTSSVHTAIKSEHKGNSQLAKRLILRLSNKQKPEKKKNKSNIH